MVNTETYRKARKAGKAGDAAKTEIAELKS